MKTNKKFIFLFVKLLLIFLIFFIANKYLFGLYMVNSVDYKSININPHDFLIYYKNQKEYQNNDVIIYKKKIYRIIGTYGQIISKKNQKLLIDKDIINGEIKYNFTYPYSIKKDELFIINGKNDSLSFGCINKSKVEGKIIFKIQIRDF